VEKDAASFFESANLDPFVAGFGRFLAFVKDSTPFRSAKSWKSGRLAEELTERLLSGKYEREGAKNDFSEPKTMGHLEACH
jgi:hypothetical protein